MWRSESCVVNDTRACRAPPACAAPRRDHRAREKQRGAKTYPCPLFYAARVRLRCWASNVETPIGWRPFVRVSWGAIYMGVEVDCGRVTAFFLASEVTSSISHLWDETSRLIALMSDPEERRIFSSFVHSSRSITKKDKYDQVRRASSRSTSRWVAHGRPSCSFEIEADLFRKNAKPKPGRKQEQERQFPSWEWLSLPNQTQA